MDFSTSAWIAVVSPGFWSLAAPVLATPQAVSLPFLSLSFSHCVVLRAGHHAKEGIRARELCTSLEAYMHAYDNTVVIFICSFVPRRLELGR